MASFISIPHMGILVMSTQDVFNVLPETYDKILLEQPAYVQFGIANAV